jgi:hypothetical protein
MNKEEAKLLIERITQRAQARHDGFRDNQAAVEQNNQAPSSPPELLELINQFEAAVADTDAARIAAIRQKITPPAENEQIAEQ